MIHSSSGNVFLPHTVYSSLQQLCMWRFCFYHMCNYGNEHSTVWRDKGLVQNFRSMFKDNWIFYKVSNHLLFSHALCSWHFFLLFPVHQVHSDNCKLAALSICGFLAASWYRITIKICYCITLFSENKKIELTSEYWIIVRPCAFSLKQANQSKQT